MTNILLEEQNLQTYDYKTINEILKTEYPEQRWLLGQIIPLECITLIAAEPAAGKSFIVLSMALAIATGKEWLGKFQTQQSKILIVDEENHIAETQRRLKRLGASDEDIYIVSRQGIKVDDGESFMRLENTIIATQAKVVVFDASADVHTKNENLSAELKIPFDAFKRLNVEHGITVIVIDHNRKPQKFEKVSINSIRGSNIKIADPASILMLEKTKSGDKLQIKVSPVKSRNAKEQNPFLLEIYDEGPDMVKINYLSEIEDDGNLMFEKAKEAIQQFLLDKDEVPNKELVAAITQALGCSKKTVERAKTALVEEKLINSDKRGRSLFFSPKIMSFEDIDSLIENQSE